jgi:hypothetical protein
VAVANPVEYRKLGYDSGSGLPIPIEPGAATGSITIGSVTASATFAQGTKLVRMSVTGNCHVKFGVGPVATTADTYLAAGAIADFYVPPDGTYSVSVIAAS